MAAGRTVRMPFGLPRHYDPVIIVKAPVLARFLSEDERITIADLRRRGHTVRDIGTRLERAPSTVSRGTRRNHAPEGGYRPSRRIAWRRRADVDPAAARSAETRSSPASCRTVSTSGGVQPRSAGRCAASTPTSPHSSCRPRRSTRRSTAPVARSADRSARRCCVPVAATAVVVWRLVIARDGWCRWSPSTSAPTSPTGPWPGTGRATSSSGPGTVGDRDAGGAHESLHDPAAPGR